MLKTTSIVLLFLCGFANQAVAAEQEDSWQFEITPYIFAASLEGAAGAKGVVADFSLPFDDIVDNLDGAFMGLFVARKGRWSYGLETVYFKLQDEESSTASGRFGKVTVDGAVDVSATINVLQATLAYAVMQEKTSIDLLTALRYTNLDLDLELGVSTTPPVSFVGGGRNADGSASWTDLVVGVNIRHVLSKEVSLIGYFDIGGSEHDNTWQYILGANWEFSEGYIAKLGYRALSWDYEDGGDIWDVEAKGAYLGLGFQF